MALLIAIDDTDNKESIGTGRLARMLAAELEDLGFLKGTSVTRHQLLVHPDIPYTSHNSCACIAGTVGDSTLEEIAHRARSFLVENFHEGANPGLCLMNQESVPDTLRTFGRRAQQEVIDIADAKEFSDIPGLFIWLGGETGQGCIGALAGVGLRSTGNDGRFIALKGIRDIEGVASVQEIMRQSDITRVSTISGIPLNGDESIDTGNWVRPALKDGQSVLLVKKDKEIWCPAEHKKRKD